MEQHKKSKKSFLIFIAIICLLILTLFACKSSASMQKTFQPDLILQKYSISQIDSVCKADTIPTNLDYWHKLELIDFETKNKSYQYVYIKKVDLLYIINIINHDSIDFYKRYIPQNYE